MAKTKVEIKTPDFDKWKNAIQDLTVKTGLKIEGTAKETAPVGVNPPVDAGNYRSQIKYDGANEVVANAKYSACIEYGTQPHIITPKGKKALHFKQNGKDVFYKKVYHKGTKPNPVMRNAAAQTQKEIPQIWQEVQRENGLK